VSGNLIKAAGFALAVSLSLGTASAAFATARRSVSSHDLNAHASVLGSQSRADHQENGSGKPGSCWVPSQGDRTWRTETGFGYWGSCDEAGARAVR
jgi:hypothetical protein